MPLSKARMRERKRRDRAVKPSVKPAVPSQTYVKPIFTKQEKLATLRDLIESKSGPVTEEPRVILPDRPFKPAPKPTHAKRDTNSLYSWTLPKDLLILVHNQDQ